MAEYDEEDEEPGAPVVEDGTKSSEAPFEFRDLGNRISRAIFGGMKPASARRATRAGGYTRQGAIDRKRALDEAEE